MPISIEDLLKQYGGNINTQSYNPASVDINALRAQQAKLDKLAEDPLSDVGVQNTLAGVRTQLTAGQNSALGAARGRAAQTGQAGFYGSYAGAANRAQSDRELGLSSASSTLAAYTATNARNKSTDLTKDIVSSQLAAESAATQRTQVAQQAHIAEVQASLQRRGIDTQAETAANQLAQQREQQASDQRFKIAAQQQQQRNIEAQFAAAANQRAQEQEQKARQYAQEQEQKASDRKDREQQLALQLQQQRNIDEAAAKQLTQQRVQQQYDQQQDEIKLRQAQKEQNSPSSQQLELLQLQKQLAALQGLPGSNNNTGAGRSYQSYQDRQRERDLQRFQYGYRYGES